MIEFKSQSAIAPPGTSLEEFEIQCGLAAEIQRAANWIIGDLSIAVKRQHPDTYHQAFPTWCSPDLISRCEGVARAYPPDDRNILATWTMHSFHAKNPGRVDLVQSIVDAGQTTDEARKNPPVTPAVKTDWLLCVDVNYFVNSFFSKNGVDTASMVTGWLERLVSRLHNDKGLTHCVFCFDGRDNHRKKLTEGWEHGYKQSRGLKDDELIRQLQLIPDLLKARNKQCVRIDGMEADDVMASYAVQFPGRVTLFTVDKDMRQCLSAKCNMLTDVTWEENTDTGDHLPVYEWVVGEWTKGKEKPDNVYCHMTDGLPYGGYQVVGITPEQWPQFQAIAGDSTDGVKGVKGIGGQGAMELILAHGTVASIIAACKESLVALTEKKRLAVLEFEPFAEVMLKLVTLRNDLVVPQVTKICMMKETT